MRKRLTNSSLATIYYTLIYSHISYCISIWGSSWACHLKPVITAQKRFVRLISFADRYHPSLPLFVDKRFLRFDYIYLYFSGLIMFKFLHHGYCSDVFQLAQNPYHLRYNVHNVLIPFFRTSRGQRSILYSAPSIWNALPVHLKNISTLNSFKFNFKRYLLEVQTNELH